MEPDKREHGRPFYASREISLPAVLLIVVGVLSLALMVMFVWVHMDRQITVQALEISALKAKLAERDRLIEHLLRR